MRLSVSKKLNFLLVTLITLGIGGSVFLATTLFTTDLVGQIRREVLDSSSLLASRTRSEFEFLIEKAQIIGALSLEEFKYPEDRTKFLIENIRSDERIQSLALLEVSGDEITTQWRVAQKQFEPHSLLAPERFSSASFNKDIFKGSDLHIELATMEKNLSSLRLVIPLVRNSQSQVIRWINLDLDPEKTLSLFSESVNTVSLLLDGKNHTIASGDPLRFPPMENLSELEIFAKLQEKKGETEFKDKTGGQFMGALHPVNLSGLRVLSVASLDRSTNAKLKLLRRSLSLAGIFIFLAMALGLLFSRGLTHRIEALGEAANQISRGNFGVRLAVTLKGIHKFFKPDEIFEVTGVFNQMALGLEEREKMHDLLVKFHSKEIAQRLLSGQLRLGGEKKLATVLFTDIRSFTKLSEEYPPEKIVTLLNRYMSVMVEVIIRNGGVVDKYMGDAIMALWSVPETKEDDLERSLTACLEMRVALEELNKILPSEGLPTLKMGMGLHHGYVIAGNIGSTLRMEYTVVGDTVNIASRIQDLTKMHETDLLVTEEIAQELQAKFVFEYIGESKVRGKVDEIRLYKVISKINHQTSKIAA